MTNPQFSGERPLALAEVKAIIATVEARDKVLNFASNKSKEYLENFVTLSSDKKDELHKKLVDLKLTRLKEEHICKIIDFLPKTVNDLKIVLQAYPLSMPKKDQDEIVTVVKDYV